MEEENVVRTFEKYCKQHHVLLTVARPYCAVDSSPNATEDDDIMSGTDSTVS
jgi:hypothetical protein